MSCRESAPEGQLDNSPALSELGKLRKRELVPEGRPRPPRTPAASAVVTLESRRGRMGQPTAVLPGFADLPIQRLTDLTPAVWLARHSWTQATGVQREGGFATTTA